MSICTGVTESSLQEYAALPDGQTQFYRHIQYTTVNDVVCHISSVRSVQCWLLLPSNSSTYCMVCHQIEHALLEKKKRKESRILQPVKPNDPLHCLDIDQLKTLFKEERKEKIRLEKQLQIRAFKQNLNEDSMTMTKDMHNSLSAVDMTELQDDDLPRLFWEEQQKAFRRKEHGMRWHPMMIRLAILIHSKSKAAYETLRKTGVLKLPGTATLKEYTSAIHPQEGFQPEVMDELNKFSATLSENQRYVVLLHDEMSVKSDLVFDSRSGELIGFVNKDKWNFHDTNKLVSHVLVFYVVGVNSSLKMSLGYFGTRTASADQLYYMFWQAVGCLEACNLKVIASTSDKAPANQRLYQMHGESKELCYKTINIFHPEREIFFISDPPHLIKTVRNIIHSSHWGSNSRLLWKDGQHILWQHIIDLYNMDQALHLRRTSLTADHINLTSHSVMNVRLAAQVLSHQVGRVMQEYGGPEQQETARFILLMDRFFDCLNSRNLLEGKRFRKPDLLPYTHVSDIRFDFLQGEFLQYLEDWRSSVQNRQGQFSAGERQKMFLSLQTYRGLVMTVKSFVEVTRYLLSNGVPFVLSHKFCQDPLEEHFGRHRAIGRSAENPNLFQFGHQENSIRLQRQMALIVTPKGNIKGANQQRPAVTITSSPMKKKCRTNRNQ